jgi:hypothetical protein
MTVKRTIIVVLALVAAGCASNFYDVPINVTSQYNPDAAYGEFKTWNFATYQNLPTEGPFADASFRLEIGNMVEEALKQYDFVRVFENPDLEVGFHLASDLVSEEDLQEWYDRGDWDLPTYRGAMSDEWQQGSLLLFVFETKSGQMIWQAAAEALVDKSAPMDKRKKLVKRAVTEMLAEMPREKQDPGGTTE